jgi:hypothetical protein
MPRPLEEYLEHADELAQIVVNAWGAIVTTGGGDSLTPEFKDLFEKTCFYRTAKRTADNHREHNMKHEVAATEERESRLAFARAYKAERERHENN